MIKQLSAIDLVFSNRNNKSNSHWKERKLISKLRPRARRFIFSEEASTRLGEIIKACGPAMMENRRFAIPPYPVTYIELDIKALNAAIDYPISSADVYGDTPTDNNLGLLVTATPDGNDIESVRVFVAGNSEDPNWALASLYKYERFGEDELEPRIDRRQFATKEMRDIIAAGLRLGSVFHNMADPYALNDEWRVKMTRTGILPTIPTYSITCCNGELRTALSALLVLNQPQVVRVAHVPASRGDARSRNKPYAAHNTVEITLGQKKEYVAVFGASDRSSPRRHEVTGHFVHHNCAKGCEHAWPLIPEASPFSGSPRWTCFKCGGTRTWRKAHERGDASIGFVTKDYSVDYP